MKNFSIICDADTNAYDKVKNYEKIEQLIDNYLDLNNYTSRYVKLLFIYIAVEPDKFLPRENFFKIRRKTNSLEIAYNVDYYNLMNKQNDDIFKILASTYLQATEKYLFERKDFNGKKFYDDLKQMFISEFRFDNF